MVRLLPCLAALLVWAPAVAWAAAPQVSFGPDPQPIEDTGTSLPFATIDVVDSDGDNVSIQITFPAGRGSFPTGPGADDLKNPSAGTYTLSARAPVDAENFLKSLTFTPVKNRIPLDETETTTITVTATDTSSLSGADSVDLDVSPVNDPPVFSVALPATPIPDNTRNNILSNIVIQEDDVARYGGIEAQHVTATVSLRETAGRFVSNNSTTASSSGTPAAVQAALRALVFEPSSNRQPVDATEDFSVEITVTDDRLLPAANNGPRTLTVKSINDAPTLQSSLNPATTDDLTPSQPFQVTPGDFDRGDDTFVLTIEPTNSIYGSISPPGPFSGTAIAIQNAVAGVRFSPVRNSVLGSRQIQFRVQLTDRHGADTRRTNTFTLTGQNDSPDISGASTLIRITDDTNLPPVRPFPGVVISDPDDAGLQPLTVTLTISDTSLGTLAATTYSGDAATVTAHLRTNTFRPKQRPNRVVGETVTTTLTIRVSDGSSSRTDSSTRVAITSVNGAPVIDGVPPLSAQPALVPPTPPLQPFAGLSIRDDDQTNVTVTVTIDDPAKGVLSSLDGSTNFVSQGSGVYRYTNLPALVTVALSNLQYQLSPTFLFPPSAPGGTKFTIEVVDFVLNRTVRELSILVQQEPLNHFVTRTTDDRVPGSLRHALEHAGNNDVVTIALEAYPDSIQLNRNLGPLVLRRNVTLRGPGADLFSISGDTDGDLQPDTQLFRIFASVTMDGLTLTRGIARGTDATGGAAFVGPLGRLVLRNCAVTDCQAAQWGGAIDAQEGGLVLEQCFIGRNQTDIALGLGGGAISLYTTQACGFVNTTFSSNQQASLGGLGGGAIYVENFDPSRQLKVEVIHCTFAGNDDAASVGSGLLANVFGTVVTVRNSIFADGLYLNMEAAGLAQVISQGGNVSDDSTRTILTQGGQPKDVILLDQPTDRINAAAGLGTLNSRLRPTPAYPLLAGSPAIGLAVAPNPPGASTDQRGVIRTNRSDAGAIEFEATERVVLNEIHFEPKAGESDYVELYVSRDSVPVNLAGFSVLVDGTNRHTFAAGTLVRPGQGIIVADSAISVITSSNPPTPVALASNLPMRLRASGRVELRKPDGAPVIDVTYLATFADVTATTQAVAYANNSITLAPQFRGSAYLPHSLVLAPPLGGADLDRTVTQNTSSPGGDSVGTPFGNPNELPLAMEDRVIVSEDAFLTLPVLENDLDGDGSDLLVVVDVSGTSAPGSGSSPTATSASGAAVAVTPVTNPLRGARINYDPRVATRLQSLPEGARTNDQFFYEIIDIGSGNIQSFARTNNAAITIVVSPGHRLTNNEVVVISGAGVSTYNGTNLVTWVSEDRFSIPVAFVSDPEIKGSWITVNPRGFSRTSEARVAVTVLGANDPPIPGADTVTTDEETILRVMADAALIGTGTEFDTDSQYPQRPVISGVSLLANDRDPDTDEGPATLKVVGVLGTVHPIQAYASTNEGGAVLVTSTTHGLASGTVILISGYGGHPSYNRYHPVTVIDADSFTIPVPYVDNHARKGEWAILNDANRLAATSKDGATVRLEIRTDRIETSLVYNPRASAYLNGLAVGETNIDVFYYAVQDRHGAVTITNVNVRVAGVNDAPQPQDDPSSLGGLSDLVTSSNSLSQVLAGAQVVYSVPAVSGLPQRVDLQILSSTNTDALRFFLADFWTTDEDTRLEIGTTNLLANDTDIDRSDNDRLAVAAVYPSHEGASVSLDGSRTPPVVIYSPTNSARLNRLAREESVIDTFEIAVTDTHTGGRVTNLVAVLVIGANDTPVARPDSAVTKEDVVLALGPGGTSVLANDSDVDIDGSLPNNRLRLVPMTDVPTPGNARVTAFDQALVYNPTNSAFLDGLAFGQSYTDRVDYVAMDSSFIFANDDVFRVQADGTGFQLEVLANDRNLSGVGGALRIIAVSPPSRGGTNSIAGGTNVVYEPQVNFIGDEVFTYTVSDEDGNTDRAVVTVRVTVNQRNGNLQANADHFVVAKGESPLLDVLANDNLLPAPGADLVITRIVTQPARDSVVLSNNTLRYVQTSAGPFSYTTLFRYEVSGGGTARAIAEARVTVVNRENTLTIRPDTFAIQAGSGENTLDVLANDNILPGTGSALSIRAIVNGPDHGTVRTNDSGTALLYTPDAGFIGQDTLVYLATDGLGGTGTGAVTIAIGTLTTAGDFFAVPYDVPSTNLGDGTVELDVLANDRVLQGPSGTNLWIASVTPANGTIGTMTTNATGSALLFDAGEGREGEGQFIYTITDGSGRTAQGIVTVYIVRDGVRANTDVFTVEVNSTLNPLDVLANDVALPDFGLPLVLVAVGGGLDGPNHGGTVRVSDTGDRLVYTPAAGFSGEETFTYTMTDSRKTDTTKVVVRVTSGALSANEDAFTVFLEPPVPDEPARTFTLAVQANDRVLPDFGQVLSITGVGIDDTNGTNAPDQQGLVEISADGSSMLYTPRDLDGPFPYVERFTYEISDGTERRAQAVVMVTVLQRTNARDLETSDDAFSVQFESRDNVLAVLLNDDVKPASAAGWSITSVVSVTSNGVAVINGSSLLYSPRAGFVGTDVLTYFVSDGLGGTGRGIVRVKVGDRPLSEDQFTVLSGSRSNVLEVLANDAIRPEIATNFMLLSAGGTDRGGTVAATTNGVVFYTPAPGYTGLYPYREGFSYIVIDDSGLTTTGRVAVTVQKQDSDRASSVLTVRVDGVNDAPTITNTGPAGTITDKQTLRPFPQVVIGDVDDQGNEPVTVTVSFDPLHGFLTSTLGFVQTGPGTYVFTGTAAQATLALRDLVYDPIENRIIVPTSETTVFTIAVDDGHVAQPVTDSATTVTVIAVNDLPIISGTVSNQTFYHRWTIKPFAGVTITEVDDSTLQPLRVTVRLDDPTHGFLTALGGFIDAGGGVYTLGTASAGVTAAAASTALRALVFVATTGDRVAPGAPEITRLAITVEDGFGAPVTDNQTTVLALHEYVAKLLAADGTTGDGFGAAVAASQDVVVVGAPSDDPRGNSSGAAYIFVRDQVLPDRWIQFQKLVPADGAAGDEFGHAVSISRGTIAVAARFDRETATAGSVYLFERSSGAPGEWTQSKKLVPADGATGDEFGFSVSVDRDTLVVGARADDDNGSASGSAYVYGRHQGATDNWGLVVKLHAADAAAGDEFGCAVSLSGDDLVVGARSDLHGGISSGSAYVFARDAGGANGWGQVMKLLPADGQPVDEFGSAVGMAEDTVVVGARRHDHLGNDAGAAYLFSRDQGGPGTWGQIRELLQPTVLNNDQFGYAVSISRDKLIAGMPFAGFDNQSKFGAAFAYVRDFGGPTNWGNIQRLDRPDPENNDQFGLAVSIGQDTVAVGVNMDDDRGGDSGSVYLYRLKYNNAPLLVTPLGDATASTNVPLTLHVPANTFGDADVNDRLTLSATLDDGSPLPAWLSFDAASGAFSGTPLTPAAYQIRVTATDEDGATVSSTFQLAIAGAIAVASSPVLVRLEVRQDLVSHQLLLSYERPQGSLSLTYVLESSTDLVLWEASPALVLSEAVQPMGPRYEQVVLRVGTNFPKAGARFFRIRQNR